ncbi:molybdenum cofactor biosynthesis protein MoaE [Alphaproteobacteria bacterium]|nr:molybdenum cofactor biosynthesis protein MoaE [Alphaproteobacteria bacterium]
MKKKINPLIHIRIQNEDFDVSKENKKLQKNQPGAIVNFVGIVRGFDEKKNEPIHSLTLEHYPGMTELEIENIVKEGFQRWNISSVTVIHRVGKLLPSDQIVFVGVASKHRQNAFDSCNYIMDYLKTKAPFWKIEENQNEKKWVEFNSVDKEATKKWEI